jgi:hypothetical protein
LIFFKKFLDRENESGNGGSAYQFFALTDEYTVPNQLRAVRTVRTHLFRPEYYENHYDLAAGGSAWSNGGSIWCDVTRVIPTGSAPNVLRFAVTERGPHHRTWEGWNKCPARTDGWLSGATSIRN